MFFLLITTTHLKYTCFFWSQQGSECKGSEWVAVWNMSMQFLSHVWNSNEAVSHRLFYLLAWFWSETSVFVSIHACPTRRLPPFGIWEFGYPRPARGSLVGFVLRPAGGGGVGPTSTHPGAWDTAPHPNPNPKLMLKIFASFFLKECVSEGTQCIEFGRYWDTFSQLSLKDRESKSVQGGRSLVITNGGGGSVWPNLHFPKLSEVCVTTRFSGDNFLGGFSEWIIQGGGGRSAKRRKATHFHITKIPEDPQNKLTMSSRQICLQNDGYRADIPAYKSSPTPPGESDNNWGQTIQSPEEVKFRDVLSFE